jgi:hypothetical protein
MCQLAAPRVSHALHGLPRYLFILAEWPKDSEIGDQGLATHGFA